MVLREDLRISAGILINCADEGPGEAAADVVVVVEEDSLVPRFAGTTEGVDFFLAATATAAPARRVDFGLPLAGDAPAAGAVKEDLPVFR